MLLLKNTYGHIHKWPLRQRGGVAAAERKGLLSASRIPTQKIDLPIAVSQRA